MQYLVSRVDINGVGEDYAVGEGAPQSLKGLWEDALEAEAHPMLRRLDTRFIVSPATEPLEPSILPRLLLASSF